MYLSDNAYPTQPDTLEQRQIYRYIRDLSKRPYHEAIEAFYRLLWEGSAYPYQAVQTALKAVVMEPSFERHKLGIINRCYHTLVNPWHLAGDKDEALAALIHWVDTMPQGRAHNPVTRKLRDALRLYKDHDHYKVLRKHLCLISDHDPSTTPSSKPQCFGDRFSDYFFIYEAGTQTPDLEHSAMNMNEGILEKRDRRLREFQQDLHRFYVRSRRPDGTHRHNPTSLSDSDLLAAINLYKPKRQDSFKHQADAFKRQGQHIRAVEDFKHVIHGYVMQPVLQLGPPYKRRFDQTVRQVLSGFQQTVPLTPIVKIQIFKRLLNSILRCDTNHPGGGQLFHLVNSAGPHLVTSLLLSIVLSCEMVRFDLEKNFAHLHHQFSSTNNDVIQWLNTIFDHVNVALALNAKHLGYFQLSSLNNGEIPDSV